MNEPYKIIPRLEGWFLVSEVASRLGVSKQAVHNMIDRGELSSVRKLGSADSKPIYIISENQVNKVLNKKLNVKESVAS